MAKTIILKLSPQIIADFQSCFDTPQAEKKHLYDNTTQRINNETGDVFIKRTINVKTIQNGKDTIKKSTLDEIDFEKTDVPSNVSWETKDIGGKLEPYEYLVGDSFWAKITNWSKLNYILNKKFNLSLLEDAQKTIDGLKSDGKMPQSQIKLKQEQMDKSKTAIEKNMATECIEAYTHTLFSGIIIDKIKSSEQQLQDKEFAELNKPSSSVPDQEKSNEK